MMRQSNVVALAIAWSLNAINIFGMLVLNISKEIFNEFVVMVLVTGCLLWSIALVLHILRKQSSYWLVLGIDFLWIMVVFWSFSHDLAKAYALFALNALLLFQINSFWTRDESIESLEHDEISGNVEQWQEPVEIWLSVFVVVMAIVAAGYNLFSETWIKLSIGLLLVPLVILSVFMEVSSVRRHQWRMLFLEYSPFLLLLFVNTTLELVMSLFVIRQTVRLTYLLLRLRTVRTIVTRLFQVPAQFMTISFLVLIIAGSIVLTFPIASVHEGSISPIDAVFTATSATCVTGLIVLDTPHDFTLFGQAVILVLIQLGGLGFMTFSTFGVLLMGRRLGLPHQWALSTVMEEQDPRSLYRLVRFIVVATLFIEIVGAIILGLGALGKNYSLQDATWFGTFHAISAFCNAGFALQSNNLEPFYQDYLITVPIVLLFVLGGIGFTVLFSLWEKLIHPFQRKRLSLHVKVAIFGTIILLVLGTGTFLFLEWSGVLEGQTFPQKCVNSLFQAATPRTAGFNTVPIDRMKPGTQFMTMLFMFIGACPGSTGGGVKVTTLIILVLTVVSIIRGRGTVEFLSRQIPLGTVFKATAIITLSILTISLALFALLITQPLQFRDLMFETISAFGTVGLSCGITAQLTSFGKLVIICLMFCGRLGPLTLALNLETRETRNFRLPKGDISVG